jgi:hypothetical protein
LQSGFTGGYRDSPEVRIQIQRLLSVRTARDVVDLTELMKRVIFGSVAGTCGNLL